MKRVLIFALLATMIGTTNPRPIPNGPDLAPAIHQMIEQQFERGPVIKLY